MTVTTERRRSSKQDGFSIVELMVAITIGLIILTAVSTVFVSSKTSYNTQDNLARLQENARFAMQFILRDLRLAGYYGCNDDMSRTNNTVNAPIFSLDNPIEGIDESSGVWSPSGNGAPLTKKANTDAIFIRTATTLDTYTLTRPMPNDSAVLFVNSTVGLNDGDIIMLSDCASSDIMQITGFPGAGGIQHNPGDSDPPPGNTTAKLSKAYAPPATVRRFTAREYYIHQNGGLWRNNNNNGEEEIVSGVTNLQILFGKDTDSPLQTTADWARVKSARITMTVVAPGDPTTSREFTATAQLRNL
jgi:type IV pilus assembly protein PilW